MANLPDVGLNAVIDNLSKFQKGADSIAKAYEEINAGADSVEKTTGLATGVISGLGGTAATVATGGVALLATAVAAVGAAAAATVVGIGLLAKEAFDLASEVEASSKKIQSQLGVTEEEAERLGETARDVWANNFAGSIEEAAEALVEVRKQLKGISDEELQDATENAIRLSDAFGIDITESTNAANVLMKQFGLSQQEAFDFITKGFQDGLNSSDDFLDSVSEYGNLFGQAGGDAGQFFSLLETGLQGGVLGTDKAGDAFKEFTLRIGDQSKGTRDALTDIGITYRALEANMRDGSITTSKAFELVLNKIKEIDDPLERQRIGVALLGTQFEDLGFDAVAGIDLAATSLNDLSGATDTLNAQYNTLPQVFEGVKRQLLVAIQPIGDALLETANEVMPLLLDAIDDMKPALEDFAELVGDFITEAVKQLIPWIQKKLIPALKDMWKFIDKNVIPIIEDLWKLFGESKKQGKEVEKAFNKMMDVIEPFVKKTMAELLEIWDIIKDWVEKNWPLIEKTIVTVMAKIKNDIEKTTAAIEKIWDEWGEEIMAVTDFIFNTVFDVVKTGIENVLSILSATMKLITGDWEGAWDDIKDIIDRNWDLIKGIVNDAIEVVKTVLSGVMTEISQNMTTKWTEIKTNINTKMEEIKTAISNKWTEIKSSINTKIGEIKTLVSNAWNSIKSTTDTKLNELKNKITGIWGDIKSEVEAIVTNMINAITDKLDKSTESIKSALSGAISTAVNNVKNTVGSLAGLATIATNIITAIKDKLSGLWTIIRDGIKSAVENAVNFFSIGTDLATKIGELAGKIITKLKDKIAGLWSDIKSGITSAIESAAILISSLPKKIKDELNRIGESIIDGIKSGISAAKQSLADLLEGVMDLIPGWLRDFIESGSPAKITMFVGEDLIKGVQAGIADQVPQLREQLQMAVTPPVVEAPTALGSSSSVQTTNVFNVGGNTIAANMDAAVFEARVLQVIRQNL